MENKELKSVVPDELTDEQAMKQLEGCKYLNQGWCNTELKCRFKLDAGAGNGYGCELAL